MARVVPEEAGAAEVRVAAPVQAPEPVDLSPVGAVGSALVNGLSAGLTAPEESPLDAHGPTPEVRHGLLEIPSIGLSQPLFEGVTLTAINRGPSRSEARRVGKEGVRTCRSRGAAD